MLNILRMRVDSLIVQSLSRLSHLAIELCAWGITPCLEMKNKPGCKKARLICTAFLLNVYNVSHWKLNKILTLFSLPLQLRR